jgi:methyl-accepting chemotaxis protein
LLSSIASIAVNVSQQDELAARAKRRSSSGGEAVGNLARHSGTIGEATRAIAFIAARTNLLSLNAAIEAASAGPAGRGFTFVAQEVKALAMQAGEAATEIDEFLSGVRSGTVEAERSFIAIDAAIAKLNKAAKVNRYDVEDQRKSAGTIEAYARGAAGEVGDMATRAQSLADSAANAEQLSVEIEKAAAALVTTLAA